jgi:hypothetical protein
MWLAWLDSRKRDRNTAGTFDESLQVGRRIEDPWRRAMFLTQCLTCYAGYEALMGHDEAVEARVRDCEVQIEKIGNDGLYTGYCRALLGTMATRRGEFERASKLLCESLALYRSIDSKFEIAGSLAQQGFLALRRGDPTLALQLFRESLPLYRNYPMSPWVTKGLAQLLIAHAACGQWAVAAQLAGVLTGARKAEDVSATAPPELSGRLAKAYEEAVAHTLAALGERAFNDERDAGRQMTREQAIELALAE